MCQQIRAAEAAKVVSQAWKDLSDADRVQFLELGRVDRERYEREKAAYKGPWKIPDIKDPNAPKKPMSAFLAFGNERRGLIAEANPTLTNTEISSLLSKLWKECPDHMKQAYRDRETRERAEFKKKFAAWERKREQALVMDHHGSSNNNNSDVEDTSLDGSSVANSSQPEQQVQVPQQAVRQQEPQLPCFSWMMQQQQAQQQRSHLVQQSTAVIAEEIPMDIFMPNNVFETTATAPSPAMVSNEAMDAADEEDYLAQEAWPFNARFPKMIALSAAPTQSRFANYSMDDILQDDELFFDDFSPMQVMSFTKQS